MAYHDAVRYIEEMNPGAVAAVGDDCRRAANTIASVLPTLVGLRGKVVWEADAAELYEQRLGDTVNLLDELGTAYQRAGRAVADYASAQAAALDRVRDGAAAEVLLGALIHDLAATQSPVVRMSDPLSQWNDLRDVTSPTDWIMEFAHQDEIDKIRDEAERLWYRATAAFDDALRLEGTARQSAVTELTRAFWLLPDYLVSSQLRASIIDATPWLAPPDDEHGYRIGPPVVPALTYDEGFPYDPNAQPTAADYASFAKWTTMLYGGRALRPGLDDATEAYAHYLDGTGTDLRIDYEEAYREDATIRGNVDSEIARAQAEVERLYRETGDTSFQIVGDPAKLGYPETENWQKTLGDHFVYGTAEVVIVGDQVTMHITIHAEDLYNFDHGKADIATGAPDDDNGRFSTLGWAKEFRTYGDLERTVTWTLGDAGAAIGGGDTQRDAPGEDRVDGRDDG